MNNSDMCFNVKIEKKIIVKNTKPGIVTTYDYFNTGNVSSLLLYFD